MRAVVTVATGDHYREIAEMTHPLIADYARRLRADFISITHTTGSPYVEKLRVFDFLGLYDRVLFLDTDIIVRPECPDLFDLVPPEKFGAFVVSNYNRGFGPTIARIQRELGDIGWREPYFNSGVMVVGPRHRAAFDKIFDYSDIQDDQALLNYRVQKLKYEIFDIGFRFNHTAVVGTSAERLHSHILHYAGVQWGGPSRRAAVIEADLRRLGILPTSARRPTQG